MGKSRKDGRWYLLKWPSARAMAQIRAKIRERPGCNRARLPLEWAVENVNHVVRGWGNYFRYGNSAAKFSAIDSYVNERLAILAAPSTDSKAATGPPASTTSGQPRWASIASAER